ncbi:MAG: CBS domain-containing protein [Proteobacteria bacterium]|nr:CBS domain-containing protein [Pseudomonadota bacterium]
MTADIRTAQVDLPVREVAAIMCFNKISGMPVVDDGQHIVGIISEKDILHAMYPDMNEIVDQGRPDFESMEREYNDVINLKVADVMKSPVITARPDDPVLRAVSIMCVNKIRRIPVADDDGRLVGIISMGDVHKAIFQNSIMDADAMQA